MQYSLAIKLYSSFCGLTPSESIQKYAKPFTVLCERPILLNTQGYSSNYKFLGAVILKDLKLENEKTFFPWGSLAEDH